MKKINIAIVGLGFGGSFIEIYLNHPYVKSVGIFDPNKKIADEYASR